MPLAPLRRHDSRSTPATALRPGCYLTDGRRLFRVVSEFGADGKHGFASLEDCLTLAVEPYSPGELDAMKLRPVRATA